MAGLSVMTCMLDILNLSIRLTDVLLHTATTVDTLFKLSLFHRYKQLRHRNRNDCATLIKNFLTYET